MVVRFFMMQAHYRSTLDFTSEALAAAEKGFEKLMDAINTLSDLICSPETKGAAVDKLVDSYYQAMNDDFNTPVLVANLFETVKFINAVKDKKASISSDDLSFLSKEMNGFVFNVLGLNELTSDDNSKLARVMDLVLELRQQARDIKDWTTSDKIRDGLAAAGIVVNDGKEGCSWK
jgi:cysteinyl-tRNA synthetase